MKREVQELVERLALAPHPEGGFFRETYRSPASTSILFLLPEGTFSRLHRIKADEIWHFHAGGPILIVELGEHGEVLESRLGPRASFQHVVPAGRWFGAYPEPGAAYALVGCTVAPAFRFEDFELGKRARLLAEFPKAALSIERLTDAD